MNTKQKMIKSGWKPVKVKPKNKGGTRAAVDEHIRRSKLTPLQKLKEDWEKVKNK